MNPVNACPTKSPTLPQRRRQRPQAPGARHPPTTTARPQPSATTRTPPHAPPHTTRASKQSQHPTTWRPRQPASQARQHPPMACESSQRTPTTPQHTPQQPQRPHKETDRPHTHTTTTPNIRERPPNHKGGTGTRHTPGLTARLADCADDGERDLMPSESNSLGL